MREQNLRCVHAFERVLGRSVRREASALLALPSDAE
jgi:hypothetical protein